MECQEVRDLLNAHLDGELAGEEHRAVAAHLAQCAQCATAVASLKRISERVRRAATFAAPAGFEGSVLSAIGSRAATPKRFAIKGRRLMSLAASHVFAVAVGAGVMTLVAAGWRDSNRDLQDVVSAHVRSLLTDNLVQVFSADAHTVRPWFAGRVDFSPPVRTLDAQGFILLGGRNDYVLGRPAAVLVYARRNHRINLFVIKADETIGAGEGTETRDGYNVTKWRDGPFAFHAASDLNRSELDEFARLFRANATS